MGLVTAASAYAADLPVYHKAPPPPPMYNWTGFYFGLNAGWGSMGVGSPESCLNAAGTTAGCAVFNDDTLAAQGGFAGAQAGFNWQFGQWVWGLEADIQASGISGSNFIPVLPPNVPGVFTASESMPWFGTARGRIGWVTGPTGNALVYLTGGVMFGEVKTAQNLAFVTGLTFPATSDQTKAGGVVGAGFEIAFWQHWSFKAEALYFNLGNVTTAAVQVPPAVPVNAFTDFKTFGTQGGIGRVGVNFHF